MTVPISNITSTWSNTSITYTGIGYNANNAASAADSKLVNIKINNQSKFVVDKNGNLGIGTSSPTATLDVVSSSSAGNEPFLNLRNTSGAIPGTFGPGIVFNNGVANTHGYIINQYQSTSSQLSISNSGSPYTTYFAVDQNGNIGIGTASPSAKLHVSGSTYVTSSLGVGTAASGTTGEIRASNEVTAYYSDARLKTNIVPIDSPVDRLKSISGVYYENNDIAKAYGFLKEGRQVGVIAQEVQTVMPEVIRRAPFDLDSEANSRSGENYLTVKYELLVPLLIEALKEALDRIEALENKP